MLILPETLSNTTCALIRFDACRFVKASAPKINILIVINMRRFTHVKRKIETKSSKKGPPYPLIQILDIATDVGVDDISTRHSWYAHGRQTYVGRRLVDPCRLLRND